MPAVIYFGGVLIGTVIRRGAVAQALTAALGNLLGLGTDDPQLLFSLVSVTSAFVPLLGLMPSQYIEAMLSLVFTILGMSDPEFGASTILQYSSTIFDYFHVFPCFFSFFSFTFGPFVPSYGSAPRTRRV